MKFGPGHACYICIKLESSNHQIECNEIENLDLIVFKCIKYNTVFQIFFRKTGKVINPFMYLNLLYFLSLNDKNLFDFCKKLGTLFQSSLASGYIILHYLCLAKWELAYIALLKITRSSDRFIYFKFCHS